jgi:receptor kinase-like protein
MKRVGLLQTISLHLLWCSYLFLLPTKAAITDNETDLSALLSFRSLISADPLGALTSWNDSLPHCQWQGVKCGRHHHDRVTALLLDSLFLSGRISPSLSNLTFLQYLSLSDNQLTGNIPTELGQLRRLHFLNFSVNSLDGIIPSNLGNCSNLEILSMSNNIFQGIIPPDLAQSKGLSFINLEGNFLVGGIPHEFSSLDQLKVLRLRTNNLTGTIPISLGNLSNLVLLDLAHNSLSGLIPTSLVQIRVLEILHLGFNSLSGTIPHSIYNMSAMTFLSLSDNQLEGTLPPDMCDSFTNLEYLLLYNNTLSGQIPASISNCSALTTFQIYNNNFTGTVPFSIGTLQYIEFLDISYNLLEAKQPSHWGFFHALTNCTMLQYLDIGSNQLEGTLPTAISNLSISVHYLGIYLNPVSGSIPEGIGKLTNLNTLALGDTFLSGTMPDKIGDLWQLQLLYIVNTMMSGQLPSTLGNLTQMITLDLRNNKFGGSIPPELSNMKALEILDISQNKLTGQIPKEIMSIPLTIAVDLANNYLNGSVPEEIGNWKNLANINLFNNRLSGVIPSTIDGCQVLEILYLLRNSFEGTIPSTMKNMMGLQVLDVSYNSLSGPVPEFVSTMNLVVFNISYNNFDGELPTKGIFKDTGKIDIRGNPKLCGGVPALHLPNCILNSPQQRHHYRRIVIIAITVVVVFIFLAIIMCFLLRQYSGRRSKKPQPALDVNYQLKNVSYSDILIATEGFSEKNLIGAGTFGSVFKATMSFDNVTTVAVKVLNLEQHGASRSFISECEALRRIRHRNLMKILSLCSSIDYEGNDFKGLIFEFMPNGNLEAWLHPRACTSRPFKTLSLFQRLNIAIDIAEALNYLHNHGLAPIVHCDLKPSNVLLDADMTARVGDFGLARILLGPDSLLPQSTTSTSGIKGSIGYIPPGMIISLNQQTNVFIKLIKKFRIYYCSWYNFNLQPRRNYILLLL